jgi:large subunit ribosomal protein L5
MAKDKDKEKDAKPAKPKDGAKAAPKVATKAATKKDAGKKSKEQKGATANADNAASAVMPDGYVPRMREHYAKSVVPALEKRFDYKNPMRVPRLSKIVVNMGLGAAVANPKLIDAGVEDLRALTGQKPIVTRARKSIATFKLREGLAIGAMVTLRAQRMWEFFDRLVSFALPRVRDFKGVSPRGFDGRGNFTMGLREQIIFPEIDYDKVDAVTGMNISFVTTARTDEEGRALLAELGVPFRR